MSVAHVEVSGGIASGKTTLAQLLVQLGYTPILEKFQNNPFWKAFYSDPRAYAFETEISFLLQHYHQTKVAQKGKKYFVCDFSFYLDLAYAHVTLSERNRRTFFAVYQQVKRELPAPVLLIHLECSPETELRRIRRRGRDAEKSITASYLQRINSQLETVILNEAHIRKLILNSERLDFANNEDVRKLVLRTISEAVSSGAPNA